MMLKIMTLSLRMVGGMGLLGLLGIDTALAARAAHATAPVPAKSPFQERLNLRFTPGARNPLSVSGSFGTKAPRRRRRIPQPIIII